MYYKNLDTNARGAMQMAAKFNSYTTFGSILFTSHANTLI